MKNKLLKLFSIGVIISPITFIVSCGNSPITIDKDNTGLEPSELKTLNSFDYKTTPLKGSNFGTDIVLDHDSYNHLYDEMKKKQNVISLAIISNGNVFVDIVKIQKGWKVADALAHSNYEIKVHDPGTGMGLWMSTWRKEETLLDYMELGTEKNYNDYYPLYYINHKFAQFGISNWTCEAYEVYETSYDDQ